MKIEIISGQFGEPGSTMLLHYREKNRTHVMRDELLDIEPFRKIISEVSGGGILAVVKTRFKEINKYTEMQMTWTGKGKNFLISLVLFLMKNKIEKNARKELLLFKELVENQELFRTVES